VKVLILTNNDVGLYKFRKEFVQCLMSSYKVILSLPNGEYVRLFQKMGCKYIDTPFNRRGKNPLRDFSQYRTYKRIIKAESPDVILTYTIKPNIYGGLAAKACHIPFLATVTGMGTALEGGGMLARITTLLYSKGLKTASCVFFQNDTNRRFFTDKKLYTGKAVLVPGSGVNLTEHPYEEYPDEGNGINLLFIGRIMKDKGIDELLTAAEQIKQRHSNVDFTLIGQYDESYQNKVEEAQRCKNVDYLGFQSDVHSFIKNAHAVVLPSYHEGMANVLEEAAASGRPVIASSIPGCKEIFDEGISGLSCRPRDVDSLVGTIEKFIALSYEQKKAMGLAGRKKMERDFDRQKVVNAYIEEINKVIGE